nr:agmatinase [Actinomycetospora cinnamomea]
MKLPLCLEAADLRAGQIDVAIGGAPWDGTTTGKSGAQLGPRAIRQADYLGGSATSLFHLGAQIRTFDVVKVADFGDADILVGNTVGTYENIRWFVTQMLDGGSIPIVLGGDHGITWPSATAVADRYGYGKVGIVHFDAHADTTPNMRGSLASHGTPMRRLIESGAIPGPNFVQVGLRGYYPDEEVLGWMSAQGMRSHFMVDILDQGFDAILDRAVEQALGHADHLYISVDIDVLDPAFAPGTGTPEPGGLGSAELLRAIRRLSSEVGMVGMDVVEVSPPYDSGNDITALVAHRCVLEAITGLAMRRLGCQTE